MSYGPDGRWSYDVVLTDERGVPVVSEVPVGSKVPDWVNAPPALVANYYDMPWNLGQPRHQGVPVGYQVPVGSEESSKRSKRQRDEDKKSKFWTRKELNRMKLLDLQGVLEEWHDAGLDVTSGKFQFKNDAVTHQLCEDMGEFYATNICSSEPETADHEKFAKIGRKLFREFRTKYWYEMQLFGRPKEVPQELKDALDERQKKFVKSKLIVGLEEPPFYGDLHDLEHQFKKAYSD